MPRKPNTTGKHYYDPFPAKLRELIKDNNTTQEELTAVLNVKTRQSITGYTDGSTLPTIDKLIALADFFNVSTDYLLGRTPEKTQSAELRAVCEYTGLSEQAIDIIKNSSLNRQALLSEIISAPHFERFLYYFLAAAEFTERVKKDPSACLISLDYDQDMSLHSQTILARYHAFECSQVALDLLNDICSYTEITEKALETIRFSRRQAAEKMEGDNGEYQED